MTECAINLCGLTLAIPELSETARGRRARNEFPVRERAVMRRRSLFVERHFLSASWHDLRLQRASNSDRQRAVRECVVLK
jgi:hypothetical protein